MSIKAQPAMPRALADQLIHEAIEILAATDDGDRLSPFHLKLVEHAVNARLNAAGRVCFAALLANVRTGYTHHSIRVRPFRHGPRVDALPRTRRHAPRAHVRRRGILHRLLRN